jgi:hypothetical protein
LAVDLEDWRPNHPTLGNQEGQSDQEARGEQKVEDDVEESDAGALVCHVIAPKSAVRWTAAKGNPRTQAANEERMCANPAGTVDAVFRESKLWGQQVKL